MFSEQLCKHSVNIPGGTGTSGRRSVGYLQVPRQLKQKVANLVAFFGIPGRHRYRYQYYKSIHFFGCCMSSVYTFLGLRAATKFVHL